MGECHGFTENKLCTFYPQKMWTTLQLGRGENYNFGDKQVWTSGYPQIYPQYRHFSG
jgi:hypothetical protein